MNINSNHRSQLVDCLHSTDRFKQVYNFARQLRDEGMTQEQLYALYANVLNDYSPDQTEWDALADTMDFIVGFCSPHLRLYSTYLQT